jgi:hypothetical protein
MGISQVVSPFYEALPQETFRKAPVVGQICWVAVPRLEQIPFVLDVERVDPTEHYATKFTLRQMKTGDFRSKNRLPIKLLNLRDTEELVVQRAKRRLSIVVTESHTIFDDIARILRSRGQRHLQEEFVTVVPLYGVESPTHAGGFPAVMLARIKALLYRQFFYCPRSPDAQVYEAVVRLDRLQPVFPKGPAYEPLPIALSGEALGVLMGILRSLFGAEEDPDLAALKDLLRETLPPEAQPT